MHGPGHLVSCVILAATLLWSVPAPAAPKADSETSFGRPQRTLPLQPIHPRIVNGVSADPGHPFPAVGLLAGPGLASCSAVLIGCRTVLTAAHCVETAPRPGPYVVLLQHAGFFLLSDVVVHPEYEPGVVGSLHDLAVLTLAEPVSGVPPARLNGRGRAPSGSPGVIVGFGGTTAGVGETNPGRGIKRWGQVETTSCAGFPEPTDEDFHLCWLYTEPPPAPGRSSTVARGDSGGPLLVDLGAGPVVAGIHSATEVGPGFVQSLDADVYVDRDWIMAQTQDVGGNLCGPIAQVGGAGVVLFGAEDTVDTTNPRDVWSFEVPAGTELLRVTLNGELGQRNANLYLRAGAPPSVEPPLFDCAETEIQTVGACEIPLPQPGNWYALVQNELGNSPYQLTASLFGPPAPPCPARDDVLCLNGERFMVWADWRTSSGASGFASTVPIAGSDDSGLFWFFERSNFEVLVKVLDACTSPFQSFWVFYAATTDVELGLTVFDTQTGAVRQYFNPLKVPAIPVQDTLAFRTCP